ncbi:MAG: ATP-dependent helicase HrpB, partial [Gammaproteobacteria bacterium]|nr:ATP-dependent helicase HrpB [Gammaproteobacteria bacterium]
MTALPIDSILPQLLRSLNTSNNVVLQAAPGAGKTTRVPLALLDEPWLEGKRIIMLEPRRLAARNAALYMADLFGEPVGQTIGFRTRLESKITAQTRIEVVTEGILTRMLQNDPALESYGLVIFDEFHERNLQADLGLALCLESQDALREDLKLLVMSATLDALPIAELLNDPPLISSEGRSYPVEYIYGQRPEPREVPQAVARTVLRALAEQQGDVLVFLPGVREIKFVQEQLEAAQLASNIQIMPLFGDLDPRQQERAILPSPAGQRKVVLATAIAETSLTIEGVRVVVDGGLSRVPRFDPRSGMDRLETLTVTQASAVQRAGRAGRLEPGVCYRLWSEQQQSHLLAHAQPEILAADLAPLTLELAQWGLNDPAQLRWLDAPPQASFAQARELLSRLGALQDNGQISPQGQRMAELGMHPRLAHMVLKGQQIGLGVLACEIAALLGERDILKVADSDLRLRLEQLHSRGKHSQLHYGARQRVLQTASRWQKKLRLETNFESETGQISRAGLLLAFAYPDRIAQR